MENYRLWKGIEACVSENNFKMERERQLVGNMGKVDNGRVGERNSWSVKAIKGRYGRWDGGDVEIPKYGNEIPLVI